MELLRFPVSLVAPLLTSAEGEADVGIPLQMLLEAVGELERVKPQVPGERADGELKVPAVEGIEGAGSIVEPEAMRLWLEVAVELVLRLRL